MDSRSTQFVFLGNVIPVEFKIEIDGRFNYKKTRKNMG